MPLKGQKCRKWPQLRGLPSKERIRERWRLLAKERKSSGFTTRGKPRKTKCWTELAGKSRREINTAYCAAFRARRYARGLDSKGRPKVTRPKGLTRQQKRDRLFQAGLTSKGKPRKYRVTRFRRLEFVYREFRAETPIELRTWDDIAITSNQKERAIAG